MFSRKKLPVQKIVLWIACIKGLKKVSGLLPARFVEYAYDSDPTELCGLIFAVLENDKEQESRATVRLDQAEKIIDRPLNAEGKPTRIVTEMKRSAEVPLEALNSLRTIIRQGYKPKRGYAVKIKEPSPR